MKTQNSKLMWRCLSAFLMGALWLAGCSDTSTTEPDPEPAFQWVAEDGTLNFPSEFLFGTAIAGFQAEMGCPTIPAEECEDRNSDWYAFITAKETVESPTTYISGDPPSSGPGYWELFDEDHQRAAEGLKNNALRLSIEWSRIFPQATDDANTDAEVDALADPKAVAHYHAVFDSLKAHGLTALVTLNHYTLPTWIHDGVGCHVDMANCSPRGWVDKDRTLKEIAKYAGFVGREFGEKVDLWVTLNEPFAVALPGYLFPTEDRSNPPAVVTQFDHAKTVIVALIEAHARMYDAIKAHDNADADGDGENSSVGVVYAMVPVIPKDPDDAKDVEAAENVFYLYNMVYLNGVAKGELDHDLDGTAEFREDLANRMDYLGINYYSRLTVEGMATPLLAELSPLATFNPLTMEIWEIYPRGLYEMIGVATNTLKLPVIITENGVANPNETEDARSSLVRTLTGVHQAMVEGAEVGGYFYWTLVDNYEWNHGMQMRFGLYGVDIDDAMKPRTLREFSSTYADIAGSRGISSALQEQYPD